MLANYHVIFCFFTFCLGFLGLFVNSQNVLNANNSRTETESCADEWFKCYRNQPGRCIPNSLACNGFYECYGGVDEENCPCSSGFICTSNGNCLASSSYICDGVDDCGDNEDEQNCPPPTVKPCHNASEFTCRSSGKCIYSGFVCDGDFDCEDRSDEENCPLTTTTTTTTPPCTGHLCPISAECVLSRFVCDGDEDCVDGSDEKNCTVSPCDQFSCPITGRCIDFAKRCNGENDCGKSEDERNCTECSGFLCPNSLICLPLIYKCDGEGDCDDGSDEPLDCPCIKGDIRCSPAGTDLTNASNCYPSEIICQQERLQSSLNCEKELDCSQFISETTTETSSSTEGISTAFEKIITSKEKPVKPILLASKDKPRKGDKSKIKLLETKWKYE